jgi:hypothetical protein
VTVNDRRAWNLYESGLMPRQIARQLGVSRTAVYCRLARAKNELHVCARDVAKKKEAALVRCPRCRLLLPHAVCLEGSSTRRIAWP